MEPSCFKYKRLDCVDNTFYKMKESKLIELKNKVERLSKVVQALINEVQANATLVQGTLTAFQLHIGKDEWEKVVAELKEREERRTKETEKKLDLNDD
jgi:hypothetical protein|tara:strand:+ start:542 stop:835 length:294 start_codon:yes stop_codon:yes gene_type:complete